MKNNYNYDLCSSSVALFMCAMQRAIDKFLKSEHLTRSLAKGNYIYYARLNRALSDDANIYMVTHAVVDIELYCFEHDDCASQLTTLICEELFYAISNHGRRIHECDLKKHGRCFRKPH